MLNALFSTVSLAMIAAFVFWPYGTFRIDRCRDQLFALRDELFDDACAGKISFDSGAYQATRLVLNGVIRFAHQLSFARLIAFRFLVKRHLVKAELDGVMNSSSAADRALCEEYVKRADVIVIEHVLSSPFVLVCVLPPVLMLVLGEIGIDVAGAIARLCRKQFEEFNRVAFLEGKA